jgi:hypothetical protein
MSQSLDEDEQIITLCDLCYQCIELPCWRLGHHSCEEQLLLTNRMHHFHAGNRTAGRPKGFETQPGAREPLHCSMILLHNIIEIFRVTDTEGRLLSFIVVLNGCRIRATLIDGDFLRQPLGAKRLA